LNIERHHSWLENSHHDSILESIPTAVVAVDNEGIIAAFNRKAEQITGFKARQTLGKPIEAVFQSDAFQNSELDLKNLLRTEKTEEIETQFSRSGNKNSLHLNMVISPLTSAGKEIVGTVLAFTDITRIKKLEMQANRTGRLAAMGEMAVRIAHEIRNPLGSIELFSTMLKDDLKEFEDLKGLAEHISSGVKSINNIVSNLLLFIRPDQQPDRQVIDAHEALKDSLFFAGHLFDAHDGIDVVTELSDEALFISGDLELLKQVFLNLILNAIQAMPGGGVLKISSRRIKGSRGHNWAEVRLRDSGCGIGEANLSKIFDPFYTTRKQGTGLGLTIVHNIAKMHGGNIEVSSVRNEGTECVVTLPLWQGDDGKSIVG
jgi:PAS domain S-box-containing protein